MRKILPFIVLIVAVVVCPSLSSCKSCNKKQDTKAVTTTDTTTTNYMSITAPKADTSLIPILSAVLDEALVHAAAKDYAKLGKLIVYRGPQMERFGKDVFNTKNKFEKNTVRITAEVLNKWAAGNESREYPRAFELPMPDGSKMPVLEVIFIADKKINRKFFGFLQFEGQYKIAEISSYI